MQTVRNEDILTHQTRLAVRVNEGESNRHQKTVGLFTVKKEERGFKNWVEVFKTWRKIGQTIIAVNGDK